MGFWDLWRVYESGILPAPGCYGDQSPNFLLALSCLKGVERRVTLELEGEKLSALAQMIGSLVAAMFKR